MTDLAFRHRVLIVTPLRHGEGYEPDTTRFLCKLSVFCAKQGILLAPPLDMTGPVINRARAMLAHLAMTLGPKREGATVVFSLDRDVAPSVDDFKAMYETIIAGAEAVAIPYPDRHPDKKGRISDVMRQWGAKPGQKPFVPPPADVRVLAGHRLYRIARAGLGCTMVPIETLRRMRAAYFDEKHCSAWEIDQSGDEMVDFYHPSFEDRVNLRGQVERHEDGEDFSFWQRFEALGGRYEVLCDRPYAMHAGINAEGTYAESLETESRKSDEEYYAGPAVTPSRGLPVPP